LSRKGIVDVTSAGNWSGKWWSARLQRQGLPWAPWPHPRGQAAWISAEVVGPAHPGRAWLCIYVASGPSMESAGETWAPEQALGRGGNAGGRWCKWAGGQSLRALPPRSRERALVEHGFRRPKGRQRDGGRGSSDPQDFQVALQRDFARFSPAGSGRGETLVAHWPQVWQRRLQSR